ncbi:TPA: hypothetical protein EYP44_02980 [Candidatus Bathyarchaeota archaeon]|nr:hypothetical protein [Candidatus Bathyarchaeota archaeon]
MCEMGAVAFKINMMSPITPVDAGDDAVLERALRWARAHGRTVAAHPESRDVVERLSLELRESGRADVLAYAQAHSPESELKAVDRILGIALRAGARLHLCHVSSGRSVPLIARARRRGLQVSCEATPHHLLLTVDDLVRVGAIAIVDPPLRDRGDRARLWDALAAGAIDVVASDHAPHAIREKVRDEVWDVSPGFPGLETELPLLLTQVNKGALTLERLVDVFARNPSRIFGLTGKGELERGYDADITIVDLKRRFTIDPSGFHSKAKYSPFEGMEVTGRPVKVLVGGRLVMDEGEILAKAGSATVLRRTR